jgi:uncharacterized protein (DUF488 family)
MAANHEVLTIGHSNHTIEKFIGLLGQYRVTALADVRSSPYSRMYAQFNREALAAALKQGGITYFFLGKELGGRPADKTCYEKGRAQYRRIAATQIFQSGLDRLLAGFQSYRIALMCAEREPLECHRTLLVAPVLEQAGITVLHVHADGRIETHSDAMSRLLDRFRLPDEDLFRSRSELIEEACYRQQERVAFTENKPSRPETRPAAR